MAAFLARAVDTLEVTLRRKNEDASKLLRVVTWVVAVAFVAVTWALSLVTSASFSVLVPMRKIEIIRRADGVVLVAGEAPPLHGPRIVRAMTYDASRWDERKFLEKWADASHWHRMTLEPTS